MAYEKVKFSNNQGCDFFFFNTEGTAVGQSEGIFFSIFFKKLMG
jgi:hypothetical protein